MLLRHIMSDPTNVRLGAGFKETSVRWAITDKIDGACAHSVPDASPALGLLFPRFWELDN